MILKTDISDVGVQKTRHLLEKIRELTEFDRIVIVLKTESSVDAYGWEYGSNDGRDPFWSPNVEKAKMTLLEMMEQTLGSTLGPVTLEDGDCKRMVYEPLKYQASLSKDVAKV